ncbi:hypothetical protein ACXYL9_12735 [Qipengyuania sp. CAU 1752]
MKLRPILVGLSLALAPLLALQARVNAGEPVPGWAHEWNGFRLAERVLAGARPHVDRNGLALELNPAILAAARAAYEQEPTATNALFLLGSADGDAGHSLFETAYELEKRNSLVNLALFRIAAHNGNTTRVIELVDTLARTERGVSSPILETLTSSLGDDATFVLVERLLRSDPPWLEGFWRRVPKTGPALSNFLALRRALPQRTSAQSDGFLVSALVADGRFQDAFAFYQEVKMASSASYTPLDWKLEKRRSAAMRKVDDNRYRVFLERDSAGQLARKLVALEPGKFQMDASIESEEGEGELSVKLRCASPEGLVLGQRQWLGSGPVEWSVSKGACDFAWLELEGSAWDSSRPFQATLVDMRFERLELPPM